MKGLFIILAATLVIIPVVYFFLQGFPKYEFMQNGKKGLIQKWSPGEKLIDFEEVDVSAIILDHINKNPEKKEEMLSELFFVTSDNEKKELVHLIEKADLTGDKSEELIVIFFNNEQTIHGTPISIAIYSKEEDLYSLSYEKSLSLYNNQFNYFIRDITGDGSLNIALVTHGCGAHTCHNYIDVIQYHNGQWKNLSPNLQMASSEVEFKDYNNNGKEEIILTGGGVASVGAGMQREKSEIYVYEDGKYQLFKTEKESPFNIYYLVLDAHNAMLEDEKIRALRLNTKALQNPDFGVNHAITERDQTRILAYAGIQLMLIYLDRDPPDIAPAKLVLGEITKKYHRYNNPYIDAAHTLIETYERTGDIMLSCKKMEEVIRQAGNEANFLEWQGYATESLPKEKICPF